MKKIILMASFISNIAYGQTSICDANFPKPLIIPKYGIDYSSTVSIGRAQKIVADYINASSTSHIDEEIGYFIFDAGTLFAYLYSISRQDVQDMDFILGRDQTGTLTLFIVGLKADHTSVLYYNGHYNGNNVVNGALGSPFLGDLTDQFENLNINPSPPLPNLTEDICTGIYFPAPILPSNYSTFIPQNKLQDLINAYKPAISGMPISFMFDAGKIASLLNNTNGIQNVAAVFALERHRIKMLLIGMDMLEEPIGMSIAGFNFCIEHCYPCPTDCPPASIGASKKDEIHYLLK